MFYSIRHSTRYRYSSPVTESQMEVRAHPRSEGPQRCWEFELRTVPRTRIHQYRDSLGNTVHHFDVPGRHTTLSITTQSLVEVESQLYVPEEMGNDAWDQIDSIVEHGDYWEMLAPSKFARESDLLKAFGKEIGLSRKEDPLLMLRRVTRAIKLAFDYVPKSTRVDSPIDDALSARKGVCQDFTHIMIALVRSMGIPCRYVSGYLFYLGEANERSSDASHAWAEAYLPDLGWVGFDPTNDVLVGGRHIRVAVGRDYNDVPPTRGIFRGDTESELSVSVQVSPAEAPVLEDAVGTPWLVNESDDIVAMAVGNGSLSDMIQEQQQQQQQRVEVIVRGPGPGIRLA